MTAFPPRRQPHQPWWDFARYPARWRRLSHRAAMGEALKPWDRFYLDYFNPHDWWVRPFHRVVLVLLAIGYAYIAVQALR